MLPEGCGDGGLRRRSSTSRIVTGLAPRRISEFQSFQALPGSDEDLKRKNGGKYFTFQC